MRALIIARETELACLLRAGLETNGFACDYVVDTREAQEVSRLAHYDVAVLDLDGAHDESRRWLAHRDDAIPPILVLTPRQGIQETIANLNAGADDTLVKPANLLELVARLRALARRPRTRSAPMLSYCGLEFDMGERRARFDDRSLSLTRRETDLLELLMRHSGHMVARDVIQDSLFNFDEAVGPNAIEACVSRLRRKLAGIGAPELIVTVRGIGYMLDKSASTTPDCQPIVRIV